MDVTISATSSVCSSPVNMNRCWKDHAVTHYDYIYLSYLLFLPVGIPRAEIRVVIRGIQDKFLLNEGLAAVKDGKSMQINLNRPRYAAELLRYCLRQQVNFSVKQHWDFDGGAALWVMGYQTSFDIDKKC